MNIRIAKLVASLNDKAKSWFSKTKNFKQQIVQKTKTLRRHKNIHPYYKDVVRSTKKTVYYTKQIFSLSPRFIFHLSLIMVVIFVLFSSTFVSKRETGTVIANKVLPNKVAGTTSYHTLATLASAVNSLSGLEARQGINIVPEPSLATTSDSYLAKPTYASTIISEKQREGLITYTTVPGDNLSSLAVKFQISTNTIKWANNIADVNAIKDGQTLIILPVSGVLHAVSTGDTIESVAAAYSASPEMIVKQNKLKDRNLREGQQVIVPDGKKPEPPAPAEPAPVDNSDNIASASTSDFIPSANYYDYGGGGGNFPYGYCTWYANSRHPAPPGAGNAWTWFGAAQAAGWATGYYPAPGAIMVTWESGWGHVAIVDYVSGGSFTVSEMNYAGWGVVSSRTITTSSVPLIGFIY